jgi:hypothetical protein
MCERSCPVPGRGARRSKIMWSGFRLKKSDGTRNAKNYDRYHGGTFIL